MNWVCTLPPLRGRGNPFSWASVAPHPAERDACKSGGIIGRTRAGHMSHEANARTSKWSVISVSAKEQLREKRTVVAGGGRKDGGS